MSSSPDTIAALATPVGTSAIAVIRASGPEVPALAQQIFGDSPPPRISRRADYRDVHKQLVDDVLFTFFPAPNSFTGEDSLEVSCHGNPFIAQKILEDLLARGCRPAEAGEFSKRAFLNGRMDLSAAEAVMDLIHARSERALAAANQQLRGALGRKVDELISLLVRVLAQVEAYLDFPDEDLPPADRAIMLATLNELLNGTAQLLATSHYGTLLRDGIKTVILGEPNAGKSSLLNRLVGRERALVSPEPGTTRDYIEERLVVGSHWLRLIDTAGLNEFPSALERRGIAKTMEQADDADLFLWVIDSTRQIPLLPATFSSRMNPRNSIAVLNKLDLVPAVQGSPPGIAFPCVKVSALHGEGLDGLVQEIARMAELSRVDTGEELIAINARHAHALKEAIGGIERAMERLGLQELNEFVAGDLRATLDAFGQISGRIDNERVLDQLFASFCIGK